MNKLLVFFILYSNIVFGQLKQSAYLKYMTARHITGKQILNLDDLKGKVKNIEVEEKTINDEGKKENSFAFEVQYNKKGLMINTIYYLEIESNNYYREQTSYFYDNNAKLAYEKFPIEQWNPNSKEYELFENERFDFIQMKDVKMILTIPKGVYITGLVAEKINQTERTKEVFRFGFMKESSLSISDSVKLNSSLTYENIKTLLGKKEIKGLHYDKTYYDEDLRPIKIERSYNDNALITNYELQYNTDTSGVVIGGKTPYSVFLIEKGELFIESPQVMKIITNSKYSYDKKGNWTKHKFDYSIGGILKKGEIIRKIEYWE
jgi:hypothetical protein